MEVVVVAGEAVVEDAVAIDDLYLLLTIFLYSKMDS